MSDSLLTIASVVLPIETHHDLSVGVERQATGRRKLSLSADGFYAPVTELAGVNWLAPVTVTWRDVAGDGATTSLTVLSTGLVVTDDIVGVSSSWSLSGVEIGAGSGLVTIAGVDYWGEASVSPLGGTIRRMSNGTGVLLYAWSKKSVNITGEGATAPSSTIGTIAVTTPVFTGSILILGTSKSFDPETGLYSWTIDGEEV